ncbi:kinesin-like protein KIF13A isoform X2 [Gigantopelta aegis]|uniref:kinesin-like protein KIF13A isoform X2 n=1 Tax=Gigantopelta aegis TaxID=1735272 RepID=UPI001B8892D1|nr:kinesin-like protein KIF13A isoform X2 [Gigantopelta aegis]
MCSDKVKVAVRLRPMNRREIEMGTKVIVDMRDNQTILQPLKDGHEGARKTTKTFAFDHCFWSVRDNDSRFATQETVFECLGKDILERAYEGYNGCIFAYGQTGSGKSFTMMGTNEHKGIIPRLCDALFDHIADRRSNSSFKVEVSYMEIYNEKVHDLLDLKGNKQNLKVREHNILGPYVDGLSTLVVSSFEDIETLMSEGNKSRTVAATNMNSESSRSHAVFNIILTQTLVDDASGICGEKVSKLSLVDLAGSERAQKTGAVGERLKEGSNINKSLTTLGLVISALADRSGSKNKGKFVPYRDSVLTWLLKDNLGGNSKTVMVATISPAADNYEETLSTLRYADRAKRIVNHAVVNEDPNARIIRELREEVEALRSQLSAAQSMTAPDLKDRLEESEKLVKEMSKTWEEKLLETEKIHQDRHQALEQMGISVQTSGIKVENSLAYLVNLNADPSLNELLVYYLKDHTLVGRPDAPTQQDIQLSGLGIMPEHCVMELDGSEVLLTPLEGSRTCVNGSLIHEKTRVKHGDRILWGNNHFFRLNCPKPTNSPQSAEPETPIDYDFAQQELMMQELGNDPIQEAIGAIEKQHEEDKQEALDRQRQMYEKQMQMLRNQLMSPGTPSFPMQLFDTTRLTPTGNTSSIQKKYQQWALDREKIFKQSLVKLREEVVKANTLVREANFLSEEMGKQTKFHVTLQIPAANLSPNRRRGAFVSEPAIQVKRRGRNIQIWSMEKLENKIIDMREMYEERKALGLPMMVSSCCDDVDGDTDADQSPVEKGDPFYESQENHNLIGVANIFLECLFYNVKLDYHVPIISQQGEVAGKLHVEVSKIGGAVLDRYVDMTSENYSEESVPMGAPLLVRVCIREARGLPPSLCNFVFCQYSFWGHPETIVVPPEVNPDVMPSDSDTVTFMFNHLMDFKVAITEEFMEHCYEGALSIEVWGHKSHGFGIPGTVVDVTNMKARSLADRWSEVMRKIELWVEIHELNDQGEYMPVEVMPKPDVPCAGVFQLRQGHSRRILVRVKPVSNSGTLPLICESIVSLSIGCITARSKLQKGLDSYQEEDLSYLRERWSEALIKRKEYLDEQIQKLINKQDKSEADCERERALIEQWVFLTEERNAVLVPTPGSSIPGSPADWDPPSDMEEHSPVIFLDLNADIMSASNVKEGLQAPGINSILPKEHRSQFVNLPIIKSFTEKENVCAVVSWDSSLHDSASLNRVTPTYERVYLIVKAVVRLSHPASMELVLRKRISINIYKKQSLTSLTNMLKNRIIGGDYLYSSGIIYEVVSNIPKSSEDLEDMETLAQMAASQNEAKAVDGETYIEKYIKGISAVESILILDKLRQEVAVKELLATSGRSLKKTTSVPNINQIVTSPLGLEDQIRADSIQDLSLPEGFSRSPSFPGEFRQRAFSEVTEGIATLAKEVSRRKKHSVGLARPNFLSLRSSTYSAKPSPKSALSPHASKIMKPMRTLQEEQHHREVKPLLHQDTEEDLDEEDEHESKNQGDDLPMDDDFQDFESYQSQQMSRSHKDGTLTLNHMTHSSTNDSIAEGHGKSGTPSMTSSGYGSQAVSTLTLSSEDSLSVKSIEENDGKTRTAQKSGSVENSSESDTEDGKVEKGSKGGNSSVDSVDDLTNNKDEYFDSSAETLVASRTRSDSLLDESVPDISDLPMQPIPSPPLSNSGEFTFNKHEAVTDRDSKMEEKNITDVTNNDSKTEVKDITDVTNNDSKAESVHMETSELLEHIELKIVEEGDEQTDKAEDSSSSENSEVTKMSGAIAKHESDSDLYSEAAMEELEKLGAAESGDLPEKEQEDSEVSHNCNRSNGPTAMETVVEKDVNCDSKKCDSVSVVSESATHSVDKLSSKSNHRTPDTKAAMRRKGSGSRPRPMSMICSPRAESAMRAMQEELARRSSLHLSEDELSNSGYDDTLSECSFGSRADLDRLQDGPVPGWVQDGEGVVVTSSRGGPNKTGIVRFVGQVEFAAGPWIGVDLDLADGKNDGSVNGIRYFRCLPRHGVFVRAEKLMWDKKRKGSRKNPSANRKSSSNLASSSSNLSFSSSNLSQSRDYMRPTSASSAKKN